MATEEKPPRNVVLTMTVDEGDMLFEILDYVRGAIVDPAQWTEAVSRFTPTEAQNFEILVDTIANRVREAVVTSDPSILDGISTTEGK
jgi:hypothetical protein